MSLPETDPSVPTFAALPETDPSVPTFAALPETDPSVPTFTVLPETDQAIRLSRSLPEPVPSTGGIERVHPAPSRIDLGCGPNKREGFFGIDQYAMKNVDLVLDIGKEPWPFEDSSIEEAHSSHF